MEEDYKKVLERLKMGYDKSQEMLQTKKMQKLKLIQEIEKLNIDIKKLNYDISILSHPRKKEKIIFKKNNLFQDIIALFICIILVIGAIPSLTFLLATTTSWTLIISQALALIATLFIPGFIIYNVITMVKHYQKATDELIDAKILIKNGSLEKSQDWLEEKISKRTQLSEEKTKLDDLIGALTEDINSYAVSYNTILTKILNEPTNNIYLEKMPEKTLNRHKD